MLLGADAILEYTTPGTIFIIIIIIIIIIGMSVELRLMDSLEQYLRNSLL